MKTIKVPTSTITETDLEAGGEEILLFRDGIDTSGSECIESRTVKVKGSSGDSAVAMATTALGLGTTTKVKLPHSGFQIAIAPIDPLKKVSTLEEISEEMINANIDTLSVVNSTSDGVIGEITSSVLLASVISSTLDVHKSKLWKHIDFRDLEYIKAYLAHKLNRDKPYTLEHICNNCKHSIDIEMELTELCYIMKGKLTEEQRVQLDNKTSKSLKPKDVADYQSVSEPVTIDINGVIFSIGSSTLPRYFEATTVWFDTITQTVDDSIVSDTVKDEDILTFKRELVRTLYLSSFLPYVQSVQVGGKTITSPADINRILNSMLNEAELATQLIDVITKWIKDNTISYVGIPAYNCDECNTPMEGEHVKSIIPINCSQLFIQVCQVQRELMLQK